MSTTTQAIDIVDQLVKAKIPKQTAKELIDYVDSQRGNLVTKQDVRETIRPIWAVMLAGFGLLLTVMLYLHSDTKAEMKELRAEMREIKELLQRER